MGKYPGRGERQAPELGRRDKNHPEKAQFLEAGNLERAFGGHRRAGPARGEGGSECLAECLEESFDHVMRVFAVEAAGVEVDSRVGRQTDEEFLEERNIEGADCWLREVS